MLPGRGGSSQLSMTTTDDEDAAPQSRRGLIVAFALTSLGTTAALAKFSLLPDPFLLQFVSNGGGAETTPIPYTDAYLLQDIGLTVLTASLGYALAKGFTWAFEQGYVSSKDSRKLIHTLSAPLFMLFWPFFSPAHGSHVFCALVPLLNAVRLYLASQGQGESSLARAVSRSGNLQEALGGPFVYVCIMAAVLLLFWRSSSAGLVALCTLAAGDGLADLVGRRYGKSNQWPGLNKSVAGSVAFWIGSTATIVGILQWMQFCNVLTFTNVDLTIVDLWLRAAVIGFVTAALELVPFGDDNYTVPLAGAILAALLLPTT